MNNTSKIIATVSFGVERHVIDFSGNSILSNLLDQVNSRWPELVPNKTMLKFITPDLAGDLIVLRRDIDVKNMHYMHQVLGIPNAKLEAELIMSPEQPHQASPEIVATEKAPIVNISEPAR